MPAIISRVVASSSATRIWGMLEAPEAEFGTAAHTSPPGFTPFPGRPLSFGTVRRGPGGGLISVSSQVCQQIRNLFLHRSHQGSGGFEIPGKGHFLEILSLQASRFRAKNADRTFQSMRQGGEILDVFAAKRGGDGGESLRRVVQEGLDHSGKQPLIAP